VNEEIADDDSVLVRLSRDSAAHEALVRDVVEAYVAGELEAEIALRTCALELHSVKGVASVLGLRPIVQAIGELCDTMLTVPVVSSEQFWRAFQYWFSELLASMKLCVEGELEHEQREALGAGRVELLRVLGRGNGFASQRSLPPVGRPLAPSAGRRLLIVDDSATVRAALSARLADRGYPVRAARTLEEAARYLTEFEPEIVVTDVRMPEVNGDELCRRIKARMKRLVPVILFSSLPEAELADRAEASGADGFVCKARGMDALVARMDELLSDEILF
jgi:CheY-like chemotaxis protein